MSLMVAVENGPSGVQRTFPLFRVYDTVLAQIIPKLKNAKVYCRMRRTCKKVNNVAQDCRIRLPGVWELHAAKGSSDFADLILPAGYLKLKYYQSRGDEFLGYFKPKVVHIESLHRVHLETIVFCKKYINTLTFCDYFTRHRITCTHLAFQFFRDLKMEDIAELITILRPTKVFLDSRFCKLYKAVFYVEGLKTITFRLGELETFEAVKDLLALFEDVTIAVDDVKNHFFWMNEIYDLLQELKFRPSPVLKRFMFIYESEKPPSYRDLCEKFFDFNPSPETTTKWNFMFRLWNPESGEPGAHIIIRCQSKFQDNYINFDPIMCSP